GRQAVTSPADTSPTPGLPRPGVPHWRPLPLRIPSTDGLRQRAEAATSFVPGDFGQSNERAGRGPLTTRTMREHGPAFSKPANAGQPARGVSTEAVPATPRKGRRPGAVR